MAVLPAVCTMDFAWNPRREEGRRERAWERRGRQRLWSCEGGVIGILGAEESPAAGQFSRPTPWHQAVHSSATALAYGPSGLPATPAFCTLVCMTSNVRSQCHVPGGSGLPRDTIQSDTRTPLNSLSHSEVHPRKDGWLLKKVPLPFLGPGDEYSTLIGSLF